MVVTMLGAVVVEVVLVVAIVILLVEVVLVVFLTIVTVLVVKMGFGVGSWGGGVINIPKVCCSFQHLKFYGYYIIYIAGISL